MSSDKASAKASAICLNLPVTWVTSISSSAAVPAKALNDILVVVSLTGSMPVKVEAG